jgi:Bor protein
MFPTIRGLGAASLIALAGCYHATVETAATPSTVVIDKSFASSWIYGLVPPKTVETAAKCSEGVAKVETQHTFLNQLVGFLTLGIYTPMQIRVTCAAATP